MGRLNDVSDELWEVARAALEVSIEEATNEVRSDLNEDDHHGHFVLETLSRRWRQRFEETGLRR